jgi:hypothetical protein
MFVRMRLFVCNNACLQFTFEFIVRTQINKVLKLIIIIKTFYTKHDYKLYIPHSIKYDLSAMVEVVL